MSKSKFPKLYRRKWLNGDKGSAYIIVDASVEAIDYGKRKGGTEVSASVDIKDCHRQCSLEFYYYNPKQYQQRLKKIRLYIQTLQDLEAFMVANPPQEAPAKEPVKEVEAEKAPEKPVEPLPELLLTEKVSEAPASIIDVGKVKLRPTNLRKLISEKSGR
jgi:hypothetical protein